MEQMLEVMKHVQEMTARMEINQAKLEADRRADQRHMQDMLTRMDTSHKKMMAEMRAWREEMYAET
jgi:hypothetical protein